MTATFASRLTRQPRPFDAAVAADTARRFADLGPDLSGFLKATAACAPYLAGLMAREEAWLRAALTRDPDTVLAAEFAGLGALTPDTLAAGLRQAKRRTALWIALCDIAGLWPLETVTAQLTTFADRATNLALHHLVAEEVRRGKLPDTPHGMVVLAMGKMGAAELNYSSDIDLICLFDESRYNDHEQAARSSFIRVTRRLVATLGDSTAEGYVFRTDLRLRPDASVTPVCISMAAAEAYYEAEGRTWERAAYIKARPVAGDIAAGQRFLKTLAPFVWRKHLDFAAIQDAHDMRLRIRDHRGLHGTLSVEGHDLKLGQGGIREIEFFTQTRQLIAGGRDPDLRARGTVDGMNALAAKGWLPREVADELISHYRQHRTLEHRLQMVLDEQTHRLPSTAEGVARIAAFMGQDEATFRTDLLTRLARVEQLTDSFFAASKSAARPETSAAPDLSDRARAIVERWWHFPALRSERAQVIFRRLRPLLLQKLTRAANPEQALLELDGFLASLPSGVQIFSLFDANPPLVDLIIDIAATAPRLARHLARNSGVLDAVIGGSFFAPWPGRQALGADLTRRLTELDDYEKALDGARRWMKEWHFRIGVHHLRGLIDGFEAGTQYADLAEAVVAALWPVVVAGFAARHGAAPGRGAVVMGMGSLGAGRLNTGSDLDLIVIYDPAAVEASDGKRPLAARQYYARLTQAMVTALTAQTAEGRLYQVDMRLRPSGRQGPVATSLDSFRSYQMSEAWTWEHLALTRARVLCGACDLADEVEAMRRAILTAKSRGPTICADVAAMRARLAEAKPGLAAWEAKLGPGKLLDIELLAQMLALTSASASRDVEGQLAAGRMAGQVSQSGATTLADAYRLCWRLLAGTRLLTDQVLDPDALGDSARAFLLRETAQSSVAGLSEHLAALTMAADRVIDATLKE